MSGGQGSECQGNTIVKTNPRVVGGDHRGIEAVMTGFTPTPARSVLKLPKSQTGFFSIAQVLRENGYDTKFMYGGEAHFDNMRQFLVGNGVESVIEEKDFEHPSFKGSWGGSDENFQKVKLNFIKSLRHM